eukprot:CAMPEP_0201523608 /NCGR_PEP_ID=MMETSP0161_2-20130828/20505_1 /ASSEMBLY_ACC=CAM_ASM_000251 /TAXON_ID=180227 /ORGANISM="Neoparamoeba aestuarina, Strain SoJaBio B1-5/56/2" /LENGTH=312 /DNA_ID=CAMNT_0047922783 /DNA_START=88 /DNA_END=1029 /DNA_ORIENTATION=-
MDEEFVPFAQREEWTGITPIPQDDGPNPPVAIPYPDDFVEVMSYFRAVVQADEKSERALKLTREVISCNPANYTGWYYRRVVMEALEKDLGPEFDMTEGIAEISPKNYQLWFHRRWLVEKSGDWSRERDFTGGVLAGDGKNYHAWAHRQWVIFHFKLQDNEEERKKELDYVQEMLTKDIRNNSAWNYRFYLLRNKTGGLSEEEINEDLEFAWKFVTRSPNNQSSWGYLRGLLKQYPNLCDNVQKKCEEFSEKHKFCVNSWSLLVDINVSKNTDEGRQKAIEIVEKIVSLPTVYQKKYWEAKKESLVAQLEKK